jgi:helix-turn-helix protein
MTANLLTKWKLLQAIVEDASLDAVAKLTAAKLLDHYSTKTGRCDPSYQTIATSIGYSRRHVISAVAQLTAGGWIETRRKGSAGRRLTSNDFAFSWERVSDAGQAPIATVCDALDIENGDIYITKSDANSANSVTPASPPSDGYVTTNSDKGVTTTVTPASPKYGNLNREDFGKENLLTAADAAPTPASVLFGECLSYLEHAADLTADQARRIIGGWRKNYPDREIIDAISRARRQDPQNPVAYIAWCLKQRLARPNIGAMSAIAAIEGVEL